MDPAHPFLGTEAVAVRTATRRTLKSRYRRIFHNVYIDPDVLLTPVVMAEAAWLFGGRSSPLAGISAAALHGDKWLNHRGPPELMRSSAGCSGLIVHRTEPRADEVAMIRGMAVTTAARTGFDLGRRKGRTEGLIRCDALANATGVPAAENSRVAALHPGARGVVQLRAILDLMDGGAESPPESRTRLVLTDAGLPRPRTQIHVYDQGGYPFARIDMATRSSGSASNTTVNSTGRIRRGAPTTSNPASNWPNRVGSSSMSVPTCCATVPG